MSFQYPLGLLGLIGVPILIIIYLIKSKFTEQTVSATYLWTLSERFLKKKKKDNKITGIISLILQILAVTVISFTIAHPTFTIDGGANEYCFVLDNTGSMAIEAGEGKTRLQLAKDKIAEIVDDSMQGSEYTLITVSSSTTTVCERETDKDAFLELLGTVEQGFGSADFNSAVNEAQRYFDANSGVLTYVLTDKSYKNTTNIEVLDVSDNQQNYSVYDVKVDHSLSGDLTVTGKVASYERDTTLVVKLSLDGESVAEVEVPVKKATPKEFTLTVFAETYEQATVTVSDKNGKADALEMDNQVIYYNSKSENAYRTLLVSETPFFLESVLKVVGNADILVMDPDDYLKLEENNSDSIKGYGLYIFHSVSPKSVPTDGSVWLINAGASVENSGFNFQGEVKLDRVKKIEMSTPYSKLEKQLLKDVDGKEINISKYSKYDFYQSFTTLFSLDGDPMIFTGLNSYGNREVVFAFDIHNSDLPLLADFVIFVKNLVDYSFPTVLDETYYTCGDKATVNVVSGCESLRVESPTGQVTHLSLTTATSELTLDEVGVYTIKAIVNGEAREFHLFSALSEKEQNPQAVAKEKLTLSGTASGEGIDGFYDELILFFIFLAVIVAVDWVVYCYDKYQLR